MVLRRLVSWLPVKQQNDQQMTWGVRDGKMNINNCVVYKSGVGGSITGENIVGDGVEVGNEAAVIDVVTTYTFCDATVSILHHRQGVFSAILVH